MFIPGYDDERVIARGGFATVYRARQRTFQRDVAVKVLELSLNKARDRRRVERECAAMGRLTGHPHIVWVLDSGFTPDGRPYLTTPFYRRGSLSRRLERRGALGVDEILHIGVAIAGALEAAHRNGILHRDVKPGNILISPYGEPALTDFGIAALAQADGTDQSHSTQSFTLENAAPEAFDGSEGSQAADVYSLASTLWTLLAGHAPFPPEKDEGLAHSIYRVQREPVPPLERDDVPTALEDLLVSGMAKAPGARPASARAFGQSLQAIQVDLGLPVTPLRVADGEDETGEDDGPAPAPPAEAEPAAARPELGDDITTMVSAGDMAALAGPATAPVNGLDDGEATGPHRVPTTKPAPWRGRLTSSDLLAPAAGTPAAPPVPPAARARRNGPGRRNARHTPVPADPTAVVPPGRPSPDSPADDQPTPTPPTPAREASSNGAGRDDQPTMVAPLPAPPADGPADSPTETLPPPPVAHDPVTGDDSRPPGFTLPLRPVVLVLIGALVALIVIVAAIVLSRHGSNVETVGDTIAAESTSPTTTPEPTTSGAPAPTRPAPTAAPTASTSAGAAPPAAPPAAGAPAVQQAADVAQRAGTALADGRWQEARGLVAGLESASDASLARDWGGLEGVNMVVIDGRDNGDSVTLRIGEIAHERVSGHNRTNLYCVTWTVTGGRVVTMAALQQLGNPWRQDEWVPAPEATNVVQAQCTRL